MTKLFTKIILIIPILLSIFLSSSLTLAEDPVFKDENDPTSFDVNRLKLEKQESYFIKCEEGVSAIGCYILRVINIFTVLIGIISFGIIVIGGLTLITAAGNETQITKGKDIVTYAIIGIVVTLSSYIITIFIQGLFYTSQAT